MNNERDVALAIRIAKLKYMIVIDYALWLNKCGRTNYIFHYNKNW